jgi:hypothetical protein
MDEHIQRLTDHASAVRSAAERVAHEAEDPASATLAADALSSIEQALHALSRGCYAAGRSIVPPGDIDESVSARYARAAASWPGSTAPSHEQQARLLVALHDAGAALRAAAECTGRAGEVLASTVGDAGGPELRRRLAA